MSFLCALMKASHRRERNLSKSISFKRINKPRITNHPISARNANPLGTPENQKKFKDIDLGGPLDMET